MTAFQRVLASAHGKLVHGRRTVTLARHLSALLPQSCRSLLDVGCGDGRIDSLIARDRPELMITGLDVLARPNASIPVATFDGRHLPLPDAGVDVVMFVDVLHHAEEPFELLAEARRVARNGILIKDHLCETRSNARILGLMDWVGNFGHGVALPYNYWSSDEWKTARDRLGLQAVETRKDLGLYPAVVRPLFENGLHFVSYLSSRDASARA